MSIDDRARQERTSGGKVELADHFAGDPGLEEVMDGMGLGPL